MRVQVPRITIRRSMLLILIVAAGLTLYDRHRRFRALADDHDRRSRYTWRIDSPGDLGTIINHAGVPVADADRPRFLLKASWHEAMSCYYAWAARHPYLPLGAEPDPELYGAGFADWDFRM